MDGWTVHVSGQVIWFAFGFAAGTAVWLGLAVVVSRSRQGRRVGEKRS